ncbi:hypothetical protein TRVA0_044S00210 [Trichomonascus vanleenenianus]|uniref:uncharacterized protein n=1 Tax=Trichomonascus vanleenenianus TaxID=2268995 RepID=UPI003ECA5CE9
MPPKRKAAGAAAKRTKKQAVQTNDTSIPEDESKYIELRLLTAAKGLELDQIKANTGVFQLDAVDGAPGAVEKVVIARGMPQKVVNAVLSITGDRPPRLVVSESVIASTKIDTREDLQESISVSRTNLPLSNDRSVLVTGDGASVLAQLGEIFGEADQSLFPSVPYTPMAVAGTYGHPETFRRQALNAALASANLYINGDADVKHPAANAAATNGSATTAAAGGSAVTLTDVVNVGTQAGLQLAKQQLQMVPAGQTVTQNIAIPSDMVGAIIGKGGTKINEIRALSNANIKINEVQNEASPERGVMLIGTPEANQTALTLIFQRIDAERR